MAIRDSGGPGRQVAMQSGTTPSPPSAGNLPAATSKALVDTGLAQPGQTPRAAAEAVVTGLNQQGFQAPTGTARGDLGAQLAGALRQFQQAQGLPVNGRLDQATADALKNLGLAGSADPKAQAAEKAARDGFEKGAPTLLKQGERQRADVAKSGSPDTNFLDALLNKLGGEHGVTADRAGVVGGTSDAQNNAAKGTDGNVQVKEAQKTSDSDAAAKAAQQKGRPDDTKLLLENAQKNGIQVARGLRGGESRADDARKRDGLFVKDGREPGILDEEADEDAIDGDGGEGQRRGHGGDIEAGGHDDEGTDTVGAAGARDGSSKSRGNAHSGSRLDGDPRRGHASVNDGSGDGPGHYRVPSLAGQAQAALGQITRDASATNRATTYSWDVTFLKPGVYGPGQKAQELVHLEVREATAFDPVWQKAQANLAAMVRRVEGAEAEVPSLDDIVHAIRLARARDGDKSAAGLGKLVRPPGRA